MKWLWKTLDPQLSRAFGSLGGRPSSPLLHRLSSPFFRKKRVSPAVRPGGRSPARRLSGEACRSASRAPPPAPAGVGGGGNNSGGGASAATGGAHRGASTGIV